MKRLLLETSTNRSCLLLSQDGSPLFYLPLDGGEGLSQSLGQKIQETLSRFPAFQPDSIAVGKGPGSYTGIRVGVAMAKALAFGWGIPLVGFCSLQAFLPRESGPFAVLFDARAGGVYCMKGMRTETGASFEEPQKLPLLEVIPRAARNLDLDPRESSRGSTIASALVLEIQGHLRSSNPGALARSKSQVSGRAWYTSLTGFRLVSPHPERFSFTVSEATPDPTFLALLSLPRQSPLEPFPLSY